MDKCHALAHQLGSVCKEQKRTLGTAESCTGGMLAAMLTFDAGASQFFKGSVVAYHNEVKEQQLIVPSSVIETYGAVSQECAIAMAQGATQKLGVDVAIAITGIAGPGGATPAKPVGTVHIAIALGSQTHHEHCQWQGTRQEIRTQAVRHALTFALRLLG